jgi:putative peptide zinc metalloprotease protein
MQSGFIKLPHPALGASAGGSVATDPSDEEGMTALRQQFRFVLSMPKAGKDFAASPVGRPGERVYVRFTLSERSPLLKQWVHRLRQIIRDRINVG